MNREEQIANAEKATVDSIREQRFAKTAELVKIPGHPLHTFTLENEALAKTIEKCREALKNGHVEYKLIEEVRQLAIHYAKKGRSSLSAFKGKVRDQRSVGCYVDGG